MNTEIETLEAALNAKVIGQEEATRRVAAQLAAGQLKLNDTGKRPKASMLLMGPTGVGKTSTAKALSEYVFGKENLCMISMNELQGQSDVSVFADRVREFAEIHPEGTVLLCDEIEKTNRPIIDLFLSLLDEGCLTTSTGKIWVSNWYVLMTSNIGAEQWGEMRMMKYARMQQFAKDQAKRVLRPELIGRITDVVVYRPLSQEVQFEILKQAIEAKKDYLSWQGWEGLDMSDRMVLAHLMRKCFTPEGGARALQQELDRQVNAALIPRGSTPLPNRKLKFNPGKQRLELE